MISFRLLFDSAVGEIDTTHRAGDSSSFKLRVLFFSPFQLGGHKGEAEKGKDGFLLFFFASFLCRRDVSKKLNVNKAALKLIINLFCGSFSVIFHLSWFLEERHLNK